MYYYNFLSIDIDCKKTVIIKKDALVINGPTTWFYFTIKTL